MLKRIMGIAALVALPLTAEAGPKYSAADIVAHFKEGVECKDGVCLPKPATSRKVCVSAAGYCKEEDIGKEVAVPTKAPSAFDLLITFELGSAELSAQARENLKEFASALKTPVLKNAIFSIDGHTDARGTEEFNQALSERRAASVAKFLAAQGVPDARLKPQGHGEYVPRVKDDPLAPINRRVETKMRLREDGGRSL